MIPPRLKGALRLALVAPTVAVVGLASTVGYAGAGQGDLERQGTLAFLRWSSAGHATSDLFVIHADGTGLRRLTGRGSVSGYRWSPDGRLIAYTNRGSLWLVHADGTGSVRLVSRSKLNVLGMTWSPDAKALAVEAQDPNKKPPWCCRPRMTEIYVVPTDGSGARLLATTREGDPTRLAGEARDPSWLPQGDEIAYTAHGELRAVRADGTGTPRVIDPLAGAGVEHPQEVLGCCPSASWSPDGRRLAWAGGHPGRRYDSIYVMNADGTGLRRLTKHAYNEYGFAWSPNGRWIVYGRENRLGIYVIGADGRSNRRVTADAPAQGSSGALTWAADGRSIAYTTDRTGRGDLYVIDSNGRNKLRLTRSAHNDLAPSWAPG